MHWWIRALCAIGLGLGCLLLLHTEGSLLRKEWLAYLAFCIPVTAATLVYRMPGRAAPLPARSWTLSLPVVVLTVLAVLYCFSSTAATHRWFFLNRWLPHTPDIFNFLMPRFVLLTAVLTPIFMVWRGRTWKLLLGVFLLAQVSCFLAIWDVTAGLPIYRDDHPSFMYRLHEFKSTFPSLVNYAPHWNGGVLHYVGTTSGTYAAGLALWPLWALFDIHTVYTPGVGLIFIVLVPLLAALSLRIIGARAGAIWAAAILSLGVSQHFFLWMLHYGTIGAATATSFILPVSACVYRVVWMDRREPWLALVLVLCTFFLILWPPGFIMCLPIVAALVVSLKQWSRPRFVFLSICGALVLLLYLKPLCVLLGTGNFVLQYVMKAEDLRQTHQAELFTWAMVTEGWDYLWNHIKEGNPVLIFLGLTGCFVLPQRGLRRWYLPMIIVFALFAGWGQHVMPNLQLSRMAIPLFIVSIPPAALMVDRLLGTRSRGLATLRAALVALLTVGAYSVTLTYQAKGQVPYVAMQKEVLAFSKWIRENTPEGGRILYAGKTVHGYGRGHLAYLPILTGHEMMACDYYHFPPKYVEYNYPPPPYRKEPKRFARFMELYNVTYIATYHDDWKTFIRSMPKRFEEVAPGEIGTYDYISVFKVQQEPGMLLNAAGTATANFNRIDVTLEGNPEEAVAKYNWVDGLTAEAPVEIYPYEADEGVTLIGIRPNGQSEFEIRYTNWL